MADLQDPADLIRLKETADPLEALVALLGRCQDRDAEIERATPAGDET